MFAIISSQAFLYSFYLLLKKTPFLHLKFSLCGFSKKDFAFYDFQTENTPNIFLNYGYDIKQYASEALVMLELSGIQSTTLERSGSTWEGPVYEWNRII